ncbi:hypothetical protein DPX16_6860 [Anabarilius grahami]|uniref:Uncharacterized protein n=1 Tax=Anabarilius grahami TaxID=495550 RepID=A0A3N0Y5H9_ANAGA|nr:hypothetical protein DPX16_6860 [Anabarilius grahami]
MQRKTQNTSKTGNSFVIDCTNSFDTKPELLVQSITKLFPVLDVFCVFFAAFTLKTNAATLSFCHSVGVTAVIMVDGDVTCIPSIEMSFKMAELDRFPGHRMEDGGARKRGGILRSTLCQTCWSICRPTLKSCSCPWMTLPYRTPSG